MSMYCINRQQACQALTWEDVFSNGKAVIYVWSGVIVYKKVTSSKNEHSLVLLQI